MQLSFGIDGCRGGWVIAALNSKLKLCLVENLDAFRGKALIDIPLGLAEKQERACDQLARGLLKPRASCVFMTPVRRAVYARSHQEASQYQWDATGKKVSIQLWNICRKIKEVDLLTRRELSVACLEESHPEIWFQYLVGTTLHSKKTVEGREERTAALEQYIPNVRGVVDEFLRDSRRIDVAHDDVLDACVLALGQKLGHKPLPIDPPRDCYGIPMQMRIPL